MREAAKAEPDLQTKSQFVRLLLSLSPAPSAGTAPPPSAANPTFGSMNLQPPSDRAPSATQGPARRRKRVRLLLEAGPDYSFVHIDWTDEDNSGARELTAKGFGLAASLGAHFETSSSVAWEFGGSFALAELPLDCPECANDPIDAGDSLSQTYLGVFVALRLKYLTLGTRLNSLDAATNGDVTKISGWLLGLYGGPSYAGERFGFAALAEYSTKSDEDLHGSAEYKSLAFRVLGQVLF